MTKCVARSAFTLIELLVVVLIIAILAAIALPQYQKAVTKSRMAKMRTMLETVVRAGQLYYLQNGAYPTSLNQLDITLPLQKVEKATCGNAGRKDAMSADGIEIMLATGHLGTNYTYTYVTAYFDSGKYRCRGLVYFLNDVANPDIEGETYCGEHYYNRACATGGCDSGVLCHRIVVAKKLKYYKRLIYFYK